jgi:hypothetical protein
MERKRIVKDASLTRAAISLRVQRLKVVIKLLRS